MSRLGYYSVFIAKKSAILTSYEANSITTSLVARSYLAKGWNADLASGIPDIGKILTLSKSEYTGPDPLHVQLQAIY